MQVEEYAPAAGLEDERVGALVGHHQPVVLPARQALAADAVPAIAGLALPEAGQGRQEKWVAGTLQGAVEWADLAVETLQLGGQGDIALPVGGGLRRARLAKRQQALANARGSRAHPQAPRCQSA